MSRLGALFLAAAAVGCASPAEIDGVAGELLTLKQNGGWCWFQDPRAIVDRGKILIGTVAGTDGDGSKAGDVEVTSFDPVTRASASATLHPEFQRDDHDAPALLRLPDGRYLAMYTRHLDRIVRWRVTTRPADIGAWEPERTLDTGAATGVTYSNTFTLSTEPGTVYDFYRGAGNNPHVLTASVEDLAFEKAGRLLFWDRTEGSGADPAKDAAPDNDKNRPYLRYASDGVDTIHFVTTEDHPMVYDNSVYHGFIRGGAVHDSFGAVVDDALLDAHARSPVDYTRIFEGDADHVAWTVDLELDRSGHPVVAFSVQRDGAATRGISGEGGFDHRYHYARFDGAAWHVHEMAYAGTRLYETQEDYTGLVAIDPRDVDTVYISTDAHPITGEPLVSAADHRRHHEIFRGKTSDLGATWEWSPITWNSSTDNLRPTIPAWEEHTALLWLRGRYRNMNNYEQRVVGLVDP